MGHTQLSALSTANNRTLQKDVLLRLIPRWNGVACCMVVLSRRASPHFRPHAAPWPQLVLCSVTCQECLALACPKLTGMFCTLLPRAHLIRFHCCPQLVERLSSARAQQHVWVVLVGCWPAWQPGCASVQAHTHCSCTLSFFTLTARAHSLHPQSACTFLL